MNVAASVIRGVERELTRLQRENEILRQAVLKAFRFLSGKEEVFESTFDQMLAEVVNTLSEAAAADDTEARPIP